VTPQHNDTDFSAYLFTLSDVIRQAAESYGDRVAAKVSGPIESSTNGRVFIYDDSPEWPAYVAAFRAKHGKNPPRHPQFRGDPREGWWFPPLPSFAS
jgi:hypothetical protein